MRYDMPKILCERPRRSAFSRLGSKKDRSANIPLEDRPAKQPMPDRRRYGEYKELNENLAPLRRFLRSQVGRPWNKIFSEIRKVSPPQTPVLQHIYTHLFQYVEIHVEMRGKVPYESHGRYKITSSSGYPSYYVNPRTGLLCLAPQKESTRSYYLRQEQQDRQRKDIVRESDTVWLVKDRNIWWEVRVGPLPAGDFWHWKAEGATRVKAHLSPDFPWPSSARVYPLSKRQLSKKEIKKRVFPHI